MAMHSIYSSGSSRRLAEPTSQLNFCKAYARRYHGAWTNKKVANSWIMERCFLYQRIVVGAKRLKALIFIAMARKRRVPEVLWRLFHNRARTLADTIISLVPSSPNCQCEGPPCLRCSGGDSMSFLLRQDDPSDYRKLLTHCFVVVRHNALMLSAFRANIPWSQHEVPSFSQ